VEIERNELGVGILRGTVPDSDIHLVGARKAIIALVASPLSEQLDAVRDVIRANIQQSVSPIFTGGQTFKGVLGRQMVPQLRFLSVAAGDMQSQSALLLPAYQAKRSAGA
jgi:hypothetical protein